MTSKERMLTAFRNEQPDMVPVSPDTSNMIPCRLTGKPFWDIYLYSDPPLWRAYIDCRKHFGFDGWLPFWIPRPHEPSVQEQEEAAKRGSAIVLRRPDRMIVQGYRDDKGERQWDDWITVYPVDDPPWACPPVRIGQARVPESWEPVEGVKPDLSGVALLREAERLLGDDGTVGVMVGLPGLGVTEGSILSYYDDREAVRAAARQSEEWTVETTRWLMTLSPQHLVIGNSGIMTYEGPEIFTDLSLPTLQAVTRIAKEHGVPTHLHACGKERELVRIAVADSDLSSIEPLEPPPMGDCDLAEIKRTFGKHIALKGNLHTTDVVLRGTPDEVEAACKWCIDVAAEGGGYILSTGDQCGRDTPDENMHRMLEVGRSYGKY